MREEMLTEFEIQSDHQSCLLGPLPSTLKNTVFFFDLAIRKLYIEKEMVCTFIEIRNVE